MTTTHGGKRDDEGVLAMSSSHVQTCENIWHKKKRCKSDSSFLIALGDGIPKGFIQTEVGVLL